MKDVLNRKIISKIYCKIFTTRLTNARLKNYFDEEDFVRGRGNANEYWRGQFKIIRGQFAPFEFETSKNRAVVTLRQIVKDLEGNLLDDKTVEHIFRSENGLIKLFEIENFTKPFTENENVQKLENNS